MSLVTRGWSEGFVLALAIAVAVAVGVAPRRAEAQAPAVKPAGMARVGAVSPKFDSYNIEMAEVTGGSFWKPYGSKTSVPATSKEKDQAKSATPSVATPSGMDPNLYEYRPPINLYNPRLRKLASALGPVYVRVSGTWANSIYFADTDHPPAKAPAGFDAVLTRKQWKGVLDYVRAVDGELVTSFATSVGTRNAQGLWTPKQAGQWLAYTKSLGGHIAATEFMNEPTYAAMGGAPQGYNAADYGRDIAVFKPWLKSNSPGTLLVGPGSVGEGPFAISLGSTLTTEDLMRAAGPVFDVYSYHLYAAASQRCSVLGPTMQTTAADALSAQWLARPGQIEAFYAGLGKRFEPGKPQWITETADAACGGDPWASTFLDTFRYLVQHAGLAHRGVQVIMHNTLASSDYGLLDPNTFAPRPNYWASLLWHKLMGTTVLDPGVPAAPNTYTYAQCLHGQPGGVTLLAINADRHRAFDLTVPGGGERYTLSARELESHTVELNGTPLRLTAGGNLPALNGKPAAAGRVSLAPASITFLSFAHANNPSCH